MRQRLAKSLHAAQPLQGMRETASQHADHPGAGIADRLPAQLQRPPPGGFVQLFIVLGR